MRRLPMPGADEVTESLIVSFDGTASVDPDGDALTYRWDFGDGTSATGAKAQHAYAVGGTYPIILLVDDGKGLANSTHRAVRSLVIHKPPIANAGGNREICTGDIITFDGSKSLDPQGGALRYVWDFGDGTASDIVNPTKTYREAGVYPVTLTVRDSANLANSTHADRISIKVDQGPYADAGPDIEACAMSPIDFDASRSFDPNGTIKRYDWDFGDGKFAIGEKPNHLYERPGDYRVFLKIEGQRIGRCDPYSTDEMSVRILQGPVVEIDARAAAPLGAEITFDGSGSHMPGGTITGWHWDFGDGETAEGPTVKHAFAEAGRKKVTLTVVSNSSSPTCQRVSGTHVVDVNAAPVAVIAAPESISQGEELLLDAGRSHDPDGAIAFYNWDFGDGETATGVLVNHRFRTAGAHKLRLTVTDEAGVENSSSTVEKELIVSPPPAPEVDLPVAACVGEDVPLVVKATGAKPADESWRDAGETGGVRTFVRRFESPGCYDVTIIPDDGRALASSRKPQTRILHINRPPVSVPGPQRVVCPGTEVVFDGSGSYDADGGITRHEWDFGDGARAQGPSVSHVFEKPGTYEVALTVTDDTQSSCASTSRSARIVVNAPPIADAELPAEAFVGGAADAALLDGSRSSDPDGGALTHVWRIGDGTVESGERVRHLFRQTGDIPVELTVTDSSGLSCGQASDTGIVTVRPHSPMLVTEAPADRLRE